MASIFLLFVFVTFSVLHRLRSLRYCFNDWTGKANSAQKKSKAAEEQPGGKVPIAHGNGEANGPSPTAAFVVSTEAMAAS